MPNETILAAAEGLPKLSRRTLLGAVTAIIPAAATPAKMKAFD
ncbi:hypothetical protein [Rhizobium leguminosarum]|nr:hypothetical protein [Rhizobium leguminosarum]